MIQKIRNPKVELGTSFPCVTTMCWSRGESLLDRLKNFWPKTSMWTHVHGPFLVYHTSSCSSWTRLFAKHTIYQECTFEVCEATIWDNWKVGSFCGENHIYCAKELFTLRSPFADSVLCLWGISTAPIQAWKDKIKWYLDTLSQRFGSDRQGTDGIRVVKFPRIHYVGNSRRDSKDNCGIEVRTWAISRKDHLHVNV